MSREVDRTSKSGQGGGQYDLRHQEWMDKYTSDLQRAAYIQQRRREIEWGWHTSEKPPEEEANDPRSREDQARARMKKRVLEALPRVQGQMYTNPTRSTEKPHE